MGNYRQTYTMEAIRQGLREVRDKSMASNEASVKYGVPKILCLTV